MEHSQYLAASAVAEVVRGRSLTPTLQSVWGANPALAPGERATVQDLSYGALRFLGELDALLQRLLKKPLANDLLRGLMLVALYQLVHGKAAAHAVVDHAVEAAGAIERGAAKGLVNAVLRNFLRDRERLLALARASDTGRYSHQQWWIDEIKRQYREGWKSMLAWANTRPPMTLRVNRRMGARDDYLARLEAAGIAGAAVGPDAVALNAPQPAETLPGFAQGRVSVQDASAQFAAPLLEAQDGMRVLDACAAPGGKSGHLLECAQIELTALDRDAARLAQLARNLERLKLGAQLVSGDAVEPSAWWDGRPFHRILADVPCSGSGVARRHPDIKWLRRKTDLAQFALEQRRILDGLWQCLERDGRLLYVTCSLFEQENEAQVSAFLQRHQDAQRLPVAAPAGGQIIPDALHDGFYYALLKKN